VRAHVHAVFDSLPPPLPEDTTQIFLPTPATSPPRCDAVRGHLLMICAAKPRNAAASTRAHLRVVAPLFGRTQHTSYVHVPRSRRDSPRDEPAPCPLGQHQRQSARGASVPSCYCRSGQSADTYPPHALHHPCRSALPMRTNEVLAAEKHQQHALGDWPWPGPQDGGGAGGPRRGGGGVFNLGTY